MKKTGKVILGLSGGVDSAVAGYLLKQQGYQVSAVFMKNYSGPIGKDSACSWQEDRQMAYRVASALQVPIQTWDFQKEYRNFVLNDMYKQYRLGRTPNPDVRCNKYIKFDLFLKKALQQKANYIATGHYARITRGKGLTRLLKAKDISKDQSYFLSALNQIQLSKVVFPLGKLTKTEVRKLAKKINLPNHDRPDSQGICFVGEINIKDFLKKKIKSRKGLIKDTDGNALGQHDGVYYYTIGQRKGLNLGGGPARYVVSRDIKRNVLTVGTKYDLSLNSKQLTASDWHWIGKEYRLPLQAKAKIRYRQPDQSCVIKDISAKKMSVQFTKPQRAIASGQVIAIYQGQELIASGIID